MATVPSLFINPPAEAKPGYKTTEFWVTTLTQVATVGGAVAGILPPKYAAMVLAASQAAYAISRGLAKINQK